MKHQQEQWFLGFKFQPPLSLCCLNLVYSPCRPISISHFFYFSVSLLLSPSHANDLKLLRAFPPLFLAPTKCIVAGRLRSSSTSTTTTTEQWQRCKRQVVMATPPTAETRGARRSGHAGAMADARRRARSRRLRRVGSTSRRGRRQAAGYKTMENA